MYDKVKLYYPMNGDAPDITQYLTAGKTQTDIETGEVSSFGCLDGMKVSVFVGGVSVIGSLTKYMHGGNNVYPLDRHSTEEALTRLSDSLHIDMNKAKVTGLEFGAVFLMAHPVECYLSKLGELPRRERLRVNAGSLLYQRRGHYQPDTLAFYDKKADAQAKGMVLPNGFDNANLLKYEIRLDGRLTQQLGQASITGRDLFDRTFYGKVLHRWQEEYFNIKKQGQKTRDMNDIKTVTEAFNALVAELIASADKAQITAFMDELKAANVFADRKYYTRLKQRIDQVAAKGCLSLESEDVKELDNEIKNAGAYY